MSVLLLLTGSGAEAGRGTKKHRPRDDWADPNQLHRADSWIGQAIVPRCSACTRAAAGAGVAEDGDVQFRLADGAGHCRFRRRPAVDGDAAHEPASNRSGLPRTFMQMKIPIPTIAFMLGLSYVTRYAGMDATLGVAFAGTRGALSVLRGHAGLAGRVPDRHRRRQQRPVRQPAEDHRHADSSIRRLRSPHLDLANRRY